LYKNIEEKDAVIVLPKDNINAEFLDQAGPKLKCVSTYSVGFDHIDIEECKKRGIIVTHTPGVLNSTVAELGVALMLSVGRKVVESNNAVRRGEWDDSKMFTNWMFGVEIRQSVVGIFGFGRIGQEVAKKLQAFEPKHILYHDSVDFAEAHFLNAAKVSFNYLLEQSDFIIVCASLTKETREIFDKKAFQKMKPSAIFINISRGGLVNQRDLMVALKSRQIRGAGLDVLAEEPIVKMDDPILKLDNCIITPHLGTATLACRSRMAMMAVENVINFFDGKAISGIINPALVTQTKH